MIEWNVHLPFTQCVLKLLADSDRRNEHHGFLPFQLRNPEEGCYLSGPLFGGALPSQQCNVWTVNIPDENLGVLNTERREESSLHFAASGGRKSQDWW